MKNIKTLKEGIKRKKVKILCSSRTGVAICSRISSKIRKFLHKNHIDFEIIECMTSDINSCCTDVDLVVSMTQLPPKINKAVISGVPFMTGNKDEIKDKAIRSIDK